MIPDAYDRWLQYDEAKEAALAKLPECSECGEKIQEDFCFEINDELICETCLKDNHRKHTEDFMN